MELVIATATAACSIAVLDGGLVAAARHEVVGRGHAERLVPQIAELLADADRPSSILVDCGPGSFTGVRVGLAAARALGLGWGVPVRGCSGMALIAAGIFANNTAPQGLCVALTGGHGEIFVQRFIRAPFAALADLASLTPEAAAATVPDALVVGSGAAALVAARGWGDAHEAFPRAADARLLPSAFVNLPPIPIYGRAPDAKVPGAA